MPEPGIASPREASSVPAVEPVGHSHPHDHGPDRHDHAHEHDVPDAPGPSPGSAVPSDAAAAPPAIELRHVHFAYPDGFEALRGVDLRIEPGERVAVVGPNGAGKSTLLLTLNGTHVPSHGTVAVAGTTIDRSTLKRIRSQVGLVFQDPDDQLFSPTVFDDVAFGPIHMGVAAEEVHVRVERALAAVGMAGFERRLPHRLSLGQRKRVALATVLSMDPSILVFDEPSAGLDPRGRRELIALLRSLPQTQLVSTHDMRLVADVFPRVVVMDAGAVVADGPSERLLADDPLLDAHGLERP
jgi:cobalt transport protein ATP-binding subunit